MSDNYRLINGTAYRLSTSGRVIEILGRAYDTRKQRLRLFYGNTKTGLDHCATEAVCGLIGRTPGPVKRPVLLARATSTTGVGINDHEIVKIVDIKTGGVLYQHKHYHQPHIEIRRYRDTTHPWRLCYFRPITEWDRSTIFKYDVVAFAETPFRTLKEAHNRLRFHVGYRMRP